MAGDSVIWDDDTILLTLNSSGQVDDIKVGLDADYNATGTTVSVWDRDLGESVTSSHNSTGHDAWLPAQPYRKVSSTPPINAPAASFGFSGSVAAPVTAPGSDGYFDGDSAIQGVRAYDPQLGAWTAPDAYAGDVQDPMSQKPYSWNRNNGLAYADPSGFYAFASDVTAPQRATIARAEENIRRNAVKARAENERLLNESGDLKYAKKMAAFDALIADATPGGGSVIISTEDTGAIDQAGGAGPGGIVLVNMASRGLEGSLAEEQLNAEFMMPGSPFYSDMQKALAMDKARNAAEPWEAMLAYGEPFGHGDFNADKVVNQFLGGGVGNLPYELDL